MSTESLSLVEDIKKLAVYVQVEQVLEPLINFLESETREVSSIDITMIESRLKVFETLELTNLEQEIESLKDFVNVLIAETPEGLPMTRAYFEKYAKFDYQACAEANGGVVTSMRRNKFLTQNGEHLTSRSYFLRIRDMFGGSSDKDFLNYWKKASGIETYEEMDQAYFIEYAKVDYQACANANGGRVSITNPKDRFKSANGESVSTRMYVRRLGKVFSLESATNIVNKWKDLAVIEVHEEMDEDYFRANAKADYQACSTANSGQVEFRSPNKFKAVNGETLSAKMYLRRIKKIFGKSSKWRELAGLEVYKDIDRAYFEEHAKADYKACFSSNGGKVSASSTDSFRAQNQEIVNFSIYLWRIRAAYDFPSGAGLLKKWKELAGVDSYEKMDQVYLEENAKDDYKSCAAANGGNFNTHSTERFIATNGERMLIQTYILRIKYAFNFPSNAGLIGKWQALSEGRFPGGIQTPEQARSLLLGEIQRAKSDDEPITEADWDLVLSPEQYKSNVVIREAIDFLSNQSDVS